MQVKRYFGWIYFGYRKIFGFQNIWTLKEDVFCFFKNKRHYLDDFGDIERVRFSK